MVYSGTELSTEDIRGSIGEEQGVGAIAIRYIHCRDDLSIWCFFCQELREL